MLPLLDRPIAHRGLHNERGVIENTAESFKNAIDNQYGIECDVVLSSDGEVMVYHDYDLNRLCGIDKKISETTKLELKSLKLLNSESGILTLDEMLYMVSGRVSVLIEIKPSFHPYIEERIFEIIRSYQGSLALQSFDIRAIEWFNKNAPYYKIGLIDNEGDVKVDKFKNFKLDFVSYDIEHIHNEELQMIRKTGIPLLTWTVNDDKKLEKSREFADNCIFENIKP